MAKQIVILDSPRANVYRYVLWATVPTARQVMYAQPGKVSAWKGASQAENDAIATGAVVEIQDEFEVAPGTTLASVRADLISLQTSFQAATTANNPWVRYGTFYDGSTWTNAGLA
jgi:hypothetical protein